MSTDVRVRLALLLLVAGLLLPRAADAQVMREYGAFAGSENFGYPGPNPPGGFGNFANGNGFGGMGGGPTDTFCGNPLKVRRPVRELIAAGAAGCFLEDQV